MKAFDYIYSRVLTICFCACCMRRPFFPPTIHRVLFFCVNLDVVFFFNFNNTVTFFCYRAKGHLQDKTRMMAVL